MKRKDGHTPKTYALAALKRCLLDLAQERRLHGDV
jgi:hypothetical protein